MLAEGRALTSGVLFEEGEVKVIGDEPANTDYDPGPSEKLYRVAKEESTPRRRRLRSVLCFVCLTMKPVGESDAGNPHVGFDERGWETERCRMAQAAAPILDSTFSHIAACGGMSAAGES
jgi:hypothetical protein